jgi:hypothetical protein
LLSSKSLLKFLQTSFLPAFGDNLVVVLHLDDLNFLVGIVVVLVRRVVLMLGESSFDASSASGND